MYTNCVQMLESKWVSSSKDILTFRKALNNPVTSLQFRKFVSIKGDNFENDVLFWQEVQKYKVCIEFLVETRLGLRTVLFYLHSFLLLS